MTTTPVLNSGPIISLGLITGSPHLGRVRAAFLRGYIDGESKERQL